MIRIEDAASPQSIEIVRELFREYGVLPDVNIGREEIAGLPGEYAPPGGALLLAFDGETGAGCVAMRRLDDWACEMKRLYVRPKYRGGGVGRRLVTEIIAGASGFGYTKMRLDTRPSMNSAIAVYRALGFNEIPAYMSDSVRGALFFELELR